MSGQSIPNGRRGFLRASLAMAGLGVLAGCGLPSAGWPARMPTLGLLGGMPSPAWDAFRDALAALGYAEGRNLAVEPRWSEGRAERFPELAAQLIDARVNVLVAAGNAAALAARDATSTVPVVFIGVGDPVANGVVDNLARPGGNLTGIANLAPQASPKGMELLKEAVPAISHVGVLVGPIGTAQTPIQATAQALGVQADLLMVSDPTGFAAVFDEAVRSGVDGLFVLADPLFFIHRRAILEFAAQRRLPGMYLFREFADEGGLLFHGTDLAALFRRGAAYVDKILKGARPADLPVEQPTRFDFVVNLKSAKALGLTIPPSVLQQATEVIQ